METYQEAKKWMTIRILGLTLIGALTFLCIVFIVAVYIMGGRI